MSLDKSNNVIVDKNKIIYDFKEAIKGGSGVFFFSVQGKQEIDLVYDNTNLIEGFPVFKLVIANENIACFKDKEAAEKAKKDLMTNLSLSAGNKKEKVFNESPSYGLMFASLLSIVALFSFIVMFSHIEVSNINKADNIAQEPMKNQEINSVSQVEDNTENMQPVSFEYTDFKNSIKEIPGDNQDLLSELDSISKNMEGWYSNLSVEDKQSFDSYRMSSDPYSQKIENVLSSEALALLKDNQEKLDNLVQKVNERVSEKKTELEKEKQENEQKLNNMQEAEKNTQKTSDYNGDFGNYEDAKPKEFNESGSGQSQTPVTSGSILLNKMKNSQ